MSARSLLPLLLLTLAPVGAAGCRLLGIEASACDPTDASTCLHGQVCTDKGLCVAGTATAPHPTLVVDNEDNVSLVAIAADGTLFWATGGSSGACVRRLDAGSGPVNVACEGALSIGALVLIGTDVVWAAEGAGATDAVRVTPQSATASDPPEDLATQIDVASFSRGPNAIAAALHADGTESVLVAREGVDISATRIVRDSAGAVSYSVDYVSVGTVDAVTGAIVTPDEAAAFVGGTVDDKATILERTIRDEVGGGTFGFDDFSQSAAWPSANLFAVIPIDDAAADVAVATAAADGAGAILKMDTNSLTATLIVDAADVDNPKVHASVLASDGFFLYYGTAGTVAPGKSHAIFRIDLFAHGAKPEKLADVDVDVGSLAVHASELFWAEPAKNRIQKLALPK